MDERDNAARQMLFNEMVERVEHGFRGWHREDGTYVDGDGRGDYRRVYGLAWRAHYAKDKVEATTVASRQNFASEKDAPPSRQDIEAQALEWAREALAGEGADGECGAALRGTPPASPVDQSAGAAMLAASLRVDTRAREASTANDEAEAQALEWARKALEQEAREARASEPVDSPVGANPGETDPVPPPAHSGGRISVRCPKCGASNTPSRTACLLCGAKLA